MVMDERDQKIEDVLKDALKNGRGLRWTDLIEKTCLTDGSLNRGLKSLEKLNIVSKEENWYILKKHRDKYTWIEEKSQPFKSSFEYTIMLRHSKSLVKQAKKKKESAFDIYSFVCSDSFKYIRQHLETGYPDIFNALNEVERCDSEIERVFTELYQEVKNIALKNGYKVKELPALLKSIKEGKIVFNPKNERLKELLASEEREGIGSWDPFERKWMDTHITVYPRVIKDSVRSIEWYTSVENPIEFIEACNTSEQLGSLYDMLVRINEKSQENYKQFADKLKPIITKVEDEVEPLRGKCADCPGLLGKSSFGKY